MRNKVISAEQAARLVKDGDVVAVGSSAGLTCPDFVLAGLGRRYRNESRPRGLTFVAPIAAGDMYGIKGVDHLAQPGLLGTRLCGFCNPCLRHRRLLSERPVLPALAADLGNAGAQRACRL